MLSNSENTDLSTEIYLPPTSEPVVVPHLFVTNATAHRFPMQKKSFNAVCDEALIGRFSPWCVSAWKRVFDLACVTLALILLSPILAMVAVAVRATSPGPVIFCQRRAGQHRKLFTIYKFRTMVENSEAGSELTATGDPRIIRIGHFLRRFKLDELPQLFNVLRGDMSLVGPRPKLPQLELSSMPCRPGITGAATLLFRKEQHVLGEIPADQVGDFYSQYIAPAKVKLDDVYMSSATFRSDFGILYATVFGSGQYVTRENLVMSTTPGLTQTPIALEGN